MTDDHLIDANSLITPYHKYYPFDFAKKFWDQLQENMECGNIIILDVVYDEIMKGQDDLAEWLENVELPYILSRKDESILIAYGNVINHINTNDCYKGTALTEWSKIHIADPWLISAAVAKGYSIVSFETGNSNLNSINPSKAPKIPDVAKDFEAEVVDLYAMMRDLNFEL